MFLVECDATNVTCILLNSTGVFCFLTNFHVSGERSFIGISFVALLKNKLPDFVLRTYVPCVVSLFHKGFLTNFRIPISFCTGGSYCDIWNHWSWWESVHKLNTNITYLMYLAFRETTRQRLIWSICKVNVIYRWVSDCCLTPTQQFFSYTSIMARTS